MATMAALYWLFTLPCLFVIPIAIIVFVVGRATENWRGERRLKRLYKKMGWEYPYGKDGTRT